MRLTYLAWLPVILLATSPATAQTVDTEDIVNQAVTKKKIAKDAVVSSRVKDGSLKGRALTDSGCTTPAV